MPGPTATWGVSLPKFPIHTTITCLFSFSFYQGQSSYFPVKLSISSMLSSRFYIRVLQSGPFLVFQVSVWGSLPLSLLMCFSTFFSYLSFLEIQLFSHILIQLLVNCFSGPWFIKFQLFFFTINVTFYFSLVESVAF